MKPLRSRTLLSRTAAALLGGVVALTAVLGPLPAPRAYADPASASNQALIWLKTQQDVTAGLAFDGLVDSFEDYWGPNNPKQIVYTYDQAVAAIAFITKGERARAEKVLNKMRDIQDPSGFWLNSYWYNNGAGEEIRKHVGPVVWMAMAVMAYEKQYNDTRYRSMAVKALDWSLQYKKPHGGISGGWSGWTNADEPWTSTEHNIDLYPTLRYFASVEPAKASAYSSAADGVKRFLDNTVWNDSLKRWNGGWKDNTGLIDPNVPLDVNPWGVLALGLTGTRSYQSSLAYVENANGSPGTLANPKYKQTLTYNDQGGVMTAYDFDWSDEVKPAYDDNGNPIGSSGPDIWLEGSAFMSAAYYLQGNTAKADSILNELAKKQGTSGPSTGGLPYSLKGTHNGYWTMAQQNCVSSTGWFILAAQRFNPFQGQYMTGTGGGGGDTAAPSAPGGLVSTGKTASSVTLKWNASTDNVGVTGYTVGYGSGSLNVSGTTATVSGLAANTAYTFRVTARDAAGNVSPASSAVTVTTDAGSGGGVITTPDYTAGVSKTSAAQAKIAFTPAVNALYVDVHYTVNGGPQQNFRMTKSGAAWEQLVNGLSAGSVLKYWFTYEKSGPQYDSPQYTYTH
ncbi:MULTISPECIES: fibronectin type III domain-containing protein [Paenibacillus]|uniref:fibronectin type III domain-containing protein n=1 Tax=Paenibacillus TaxID=44249 RepID=UPI0022B8A2B9|nr:fibronectin type III domain-containing protein [Paenibacillus caseinilyticus]MCZ8518643.1 fibronectin type III domain-containing protein [Paenibacillus caseinilyticus]